MFLNLRLKKAAATEKDRKIEIVTEVAERLKTRRTLE
jgi:hypothetical protein